MDSIRLYYGSDCMQPKLLLSHFFRCIGFYVEEISGQARVSKAEPAAEIYLISFEYVQEHGKLINFEKPENKILICFGGFRTDAFEEGLQVIDWKENNDLGLLQDVIRALNAILQSKKEQPDHIYSGCKAWKDLVEAAARFYVKNELMPIIRYSHYFYGEKHLFQRIYRAYTQYIADLQSLDEFLQEDLLQYMILYAKFELDLSCKKNHYILWTDSKGLIVECETLIKKYNTNEELRIMLADARFELENDWLQALDDYQFPGLWHCRYSYLKCGRIVRLYMKEYVSAINILKKALEFKSDYFEAEYQLAECYEAMGLYTKACTVYENIMKQFKQKYSVHMMSPFELEYLYKAMVKIALISQNHLLDLLTASEYVKESEKLKKEITNHKYLELIWPGVMEDDELIAAIDRVIADRMKVQWDKFY